MGVETAIAGAVLGAGSQLMQGSAAADSASYQAAVARQNSTIAKVNAGYARDSATRQLVKGEFTQQQNDLKTAQILGQQTVAMGSSGLDINSGTFRRIQKSTQELGRQDSMQIRENANIDYFNDMIRAANFENQSAMFTQESAFMESTADNSMLAGWINAGSSLLGSATSVNKTYPGTF